MAFSEPAYDAPLAWQERSLRRSLDRAHARSVDQMERLVAAARELANDSGSAAFTVAQAAARAQLSLKVFYRCFAGKDDLLLALLEQDSTIGARMLADAIAKQTRPADRVKAYVEGIFELLTHPGAVGYAGVLVSEHRRLAQHHPDELRVALAPLVGMLAGELSAATECGTADVQDADRAAETLFALLLVGINDVTLGRTDPQETADWLWRFCWLGLGTEGQASPGRRKGGRG